MVGARAHAGEGPVAHETAEWLLEVRDLTRRFGGIVAVDEITLAVAPWQIAGLIGPNGAGKTTVFNLVTGLYTPDAGDICLEGESLLTLPPHEIARRGIGRTFQAGQLFRTMSVRENVVLGAQSGTRWRDHHRANARAL
jgi:branched-chain amino acid transport system ATP-binding protein